MAISNLENVIRFYKNEEKVKNDKTDASCELSYNECVSKDIASAALIKIKKVNKNKRILKEENQLKAEDGFIAETAQICYNTIV